MSQGRHVDCSRLQSSITRAGRLTSCSATALCAVLAPKSCRSSVTASHLTIKCWDYRSPAQLGTLKDNLRSNYTLYLQLYSNHKAFSFSFETGLAMQPEAGLKLKDHRSFLIQLSGYLVYRNPPPYLAKFSELQLVGILINIQNEINFIIFS